MAEVILDVLCEFLSIGPEKTLTLLLMLCLNSFKKLDFNATVSYCN